MEIRGEAGWGHEGGLSGGWDKAWNVAPGNSLSCENPDPTVQTVSGQIELDRPLPPRSRPSPIDEIISVTGSNRPISDLRIGEPCRGKQTLNDHRRRIAIRYEYRSVGYAGFDAARRADVALPWQHLSADLRENFHVCGPYRIDCEGRSN